MNEIRKPDAVLARLILPQKLQPGILYIPSQFVLPFSVNGRQYVFHMLTKQCLEAELPNSARVGEGFDPLIEAMFLVPEDRDECKYYESVSNMIRLFGKKNGIPSYTILPTLACNARCVYCYEEGMKQVTMTPEITEQTIRYILETRTKEPVTLKWFGGEPLLCPETIDRICGALRDADVPFQSTIITNGSLLTAEILDKMLRRWNLVFTQISMDGAERDYIARKRYSHNSDQYHFVMDAVSRLSEAGIHTSIRCNVDEENWDGIPQFLNDLKQFVAHKEHVSLYLSPLLQVRTGENDVALWEKIRAARHLIVDAGFQPHGFMDPAMKFRANRCLSDGGGVVICPDGGLFPCEQCPEQNRYGDVFNGVTNEKARYDFCRTDRTREKCRKCPFLPECTSFASCPWKDTHCREMHEMFTLDFLKRLVDCQNPEREPSDEPDFSC